jgi:hypothetical protein
MNILKKLSLSLVLLFSISGSLHAADEGQLRFGFDLGFSPVDLEAEKTAQEIANTAGSTVTVAYDTGAFVGRLFAEYGLSNNLDLEFGVFSTSDTTATYTLSGASASESYNADGIDFSLNFKDGDGFFGKLGMHSSTVNGTASIVIGGTTYAVTASREGSGPLFGGGWQNDDVRYSITHYIDVGDTTDYTMFSVGWLF